MLSNKERQREREREDAFIGVFYVCITPLTKYLRVHKKIFQSSIQLTLITLLSGFNGSYISMRVI